MAEFALESGAFGHAQPIPNRYTCEGEDLSPPLRWANVPDEARSLALSSTTPMPRAGSSHTGSHGDLIRARAGWARARPGRARGETGSGSSATAGPCPPPGRGRHRYLFRLYALDGDLELESGAEKAELEQAIEGHVLTIAELVGTYER